MMNEREIIKELLKPCPCIDFDSTDSSSSTTTDCSDEERIKRTRIKDFVEAVVPKYKDFEFKNHFRMSRESVTKLCEIILDKKEHVAGRASISKEKGILMTIWYLANLESFRQISDRFGITQSACYTTISYIVQSLVNLKDKYIKWPEKRDYSTIADAFQKNKGIPNIIGAIDGSHIAINKPKANQIDYVNRKGFHSILLQGVVNHKKIFTDIFGGEPGSLHDARMLRKSGLYKKASADDQLFENYYLLGDSAYPAWINWIVPPYKDNGFLTQNQKDFNYRHSATRIIVENAFSLLKGRFRRLKHFDNKNIDFIVKCIVGAVVLHNLCIIWDNEDDVETVDSAVTEQPQQACEDINEELQEGWTRHDELFRTLY